jgi:hypothetical protein
VELLVFRSHFLHPRLQETGRKGIIASRTFCSLAIEEMSPGLKRSGKESSQDGEGCFFLRSSATSSLNESKSYPRTII